MLWRKASAKLKELPWVAAKRNIFSLNRSFIRYKK